MLVLPHSLELEQWVGVGMRTNALRYGFAISCGVALIALACGETENDGSGSEPTTTEGTSLGGSGGSGANTQSGDAASTGTPSVVSASVVTVAAATSSAVTGTTTSSGAGGNSNTSMGGSGNSAGGVSSSGAAGAAGAPTRGCGDCEPTTESFGDDDCEVWICFGSGSQQLVEAGCEALPTQVPRYCCPKELSIECE